MWTTSLLVSHWKTWKFKQNEHTPVFYSSMENINCSRHILLHAFNKWTSCPAMESIHYTRHTAIHDWKSCLLIQPWKPSISPDTDSRCMEYQSLIQSWKIATVADTFHFLSEIHKPAVQPWKPSISPDTPFMHGISLSHPVMENSHCTRHTLLHVWNKSVSYLTRQNSQQLWRP